MTSSVTPSLSSAVTTGSARKVPLVIPATGCGGTGRELARHGDLSALDAFLLGPIGPARSTGRPVRIEAVHGGLLHDQAPAVPVDRVILELLPWVRARGVVVQCALRAGSPGVLGEIAATLRKSPDFGCVGAVEIDLTAVRDSARPPIGGMPQEEPRTALGADPQDCLRVMSRVREQLPRNVTLIGKLGLDCPDLVASARAAIGGGAGALVLSGAVPAERDGTWLTGPAIAPVTRRMVRHLASAMAAGRCPQVPIVGVGGVHDLTSATLLLDAGASGVQVGTALFADPGLLWSLQQTLVQLGPSPLPQQG